MMDKHEAGFSSNGGWFDRIATHELHAEASSHAMPLRPRLPYPFESFGSSETEPEEESDAVVRATLIDGDDRTASHHVPVHAAQRHFDPEPRPAHIAISASKPAPTDMPPTREHVAAHPTAPNHLQRPVAATPKDTRPAERTTSSNATQPTAVAALLRPPPHSTPPPAAHHDAAAPPASTHGTQAQPEHRVTLHATGVLRPTELTAFPPERQHPEKETQERLGHTPSAKRDTTPAPARSQQAVRMQAPLAPQTAQTADPVVEIHIGRLELRALLNSEPAASAPKTNAVPRKDALSAYLARRARGARS